MARPLPGAPGWSTLSTRPPVSPLEVLPWGPRPPSAPRVGSSRSRPLTRGLPRQRGSPVLRDGAVAVPGAPGTPRSLGPSPAPPCVGCVTLSPFLPCLCLCCPTCKMGMGIVPLSKGCYKDWRDHRSEGLGTALALGRNTCMLGAVVLVLVLAPRWHWASVWAWIPGTQYCLQG